MVRLYKDLIEADTEAMLIIGNVARHWIKSRMKFKLIILVSLFTVMVIINVSPINCSNEDDYGQLQLEGELLILLFYIIQSNH